MTVKFFANKRYDTATAKKLGTADNGKQGDFGLETTLYRKLTGEYFFAEVGGAMTRCAQRTAEGGWAGGELLTPTTFEEAKAWAKVNLPETDYKAAFEPKITGNIAINLTISAKTAAAARKVAASQNLSLAGWVRVLIEQDLMTRGEL